MSTSNSDTSRGMIKYTSRDYDSLIKEFWDIVPKLSEIWKPQADSDPGVVLGKYLASVADMLGVNLDWLANEIYAPSVSQRKNAEKIFDLIGYELGWYVAARTEITFKNSSTSPIYIDFGFNGNNFATVNAYTDITNQSRVITYNIIPNTNAFSKIDSRSIRNTTTDTSNVFVSHDKVFLNPGESVTRVGIEGELRSYSIPVNQVKQNNYIIKLPSQHLDTTAVWMKARASLSDEDFLSTQWIQVASAADFITPEPRFAVTYDSYSNAQIHVSNYINQLEDYSDNYLVIYWIECSGTIGCVSKNVLTNYLQAASDGPSSDSGEITISNLSNIVELPNTYTVSGKSPETAKEAYYNSRNYINTWDSLITLPDFNRFLNREPGVDCGLVVDCQKALEINQSIYNDSSLTDVQKSKMYITNYDFPAGEPIFDWSVVLETKYDSSDPLANVYAKNFKRYTAMCFAIHNDFNDSEYGQGQTSTATISRNSKFFRYKPPAQFIEAVKRDYAPLQAMTVELEFGYLRIFPFYIVGEIYPKKPVSVDVGNNIIQSVKEALALYFSPANRHIGEKPTVMEVVDVIRNANSLIDYFDAGSLNNPVITYTDCDVEYFNAISFARYKDPGVSADNIRIAPAFLDK